MTEEITSPAVKSIATMTKADGHAKTATSSGIVVEIPITSLPQANDSDEAAIEANDLTATTPSSVGEEGNNDETIELPATSSGKEENADKTIALLTTLSGEERNDVNEMIEPPITSSDKEGKNACNIVKIDLSRDDADENVFDDNIQFDFDIASPRNMKTRTLHSSEDGEISSDETESVDKLFSKHDHKNGCCNETSTVDDKTYENDKFEWTEGCEQINGSLPPSFSGSYLYIKDKSKPNTMYMPGVSIINPPREKRHPEIFVCAVKCGKANDLNFMYAKTADIVAFFEGISTENIIFYCHNLVEKYLLT